jgi:RNA polymerase sigma factor for flagellar operon FliA
MVHMTAAMTKAEFSADITSVQDGLDSAVSAAACNAADTTAPAAAGHDVPSVTDERLVVDNMPLVGHLVREAMNRLPQHVNRDDLVSAGMTALVLSARTFEASRGVPFARFAAIRIRGAILDELRSLDWASRSVRGRARDVDAVRTDLVNTLGRSPRQDELASVMGISVSELDAIDADVQRASILSLQGFAPETGAAMLPDAQRGPEQLLVDREQIGFLHDAVAELPERLAFVVRAYFFDQRQMSDIAAELGVTESRISQLRSEALTMLRHGMRAQTEELPDAEEKGRAAAKIASYAAAVVNRSSLSSRLAVSTPLGESIAAAYSPAYRSFSTHAATRTSA